MSNIKDLPQFFVDEATQFPKSERDRSTAVDDSPALVTRLSDDYIDRVATLEQEREIGPKTASGKLVSQLFP